MKNPSGVSRRALPLFGGEPARWTSQHGSLTFTQYGAGLPYGGINQVGLAIEMLWLDETVYPTVAPSTIGELEWIQYQLDTHATVADVVASLEKFSIRPVGGKIHYMLADPSGDRALVEFVDGAARVTRGESRALVCTNDTQKLSELAFAALRKMPLEGNSSRVRYARLRRDLDVRDVPPTVAGAFVLLDSVAETGRRYRTQWSAVYELGSKQVHIKPGEAKRAATIDAATLDYGPASGTSFQDLFGKKLGNDGFVPITQAAQRAMLARNLPKVGLNQQHDEIARHLLDPTDSEVRPLSDRATLKVKIRASAPGGFARIAVFRSQRELTRRRSEHVGSLLLDETDREIAFYNLPNGTYAVGAFHDRDQDGRPGVDEPLAFFSPNPKATGGQFADLAFELAVSEKRVEIVLD
ncbi:MAG: DUF2141 domain-containing protein [Ahniella sp.]|nr:DUF2141 domain-containing protein [Ahniella sp.]